MTTIVICLGPKSIMSLVRMCTVTVSLFRMCMCMCLRARERERREASSKGSDVDQVPTLNPSKDQCMEKGEVELSITPQHLLLSEKPFHILAGLNPHPVVEADDLKSLVGPYSPKRQLTTESKEPLQKITLRHLKTGLLWLSNRASEHRELFPYGIKSQSAHQDKVRIDVEHAEELDRRLSCGPAAASPVQTHKLAWSECELCVAESTPFIAHHTLHELLREDGNAGLEVVIMEEKPKTLVDELRDTDKSTYAQGACPEDLRLSCQCSQLPNQILATMASSCTISLID